MPNKIIPFTQFQADLRAAVLNTMGLFAAGVMETDKMDGSCRG